MEKAVLNKILLRVLILLLLFPTVLAMWAFALPAQYTESFLGELNAKCARLDSAPGPRIVVVGGSSIAFGVDSALLEEATGYTVVNFGLYAALGTQTMLELSKDSIRPGDIVIVSPEQQTQTLSCYFNAEAMWQGADGNFSLLARLDREHLGAMAGQFPSFAAEKFSYWLRGTPPLPEGVYRRSSFNELGDLEAPEVSSNIMAGLYDPAMPILLDGPDRDFIQSLNNYAADLAERGARVYYRLCPMNALALEPEADLDAYCDFLSEELCFPVLGDPRNSVFDAAWFYDTNFHLNRAGRTLNTRSLARDLKAVLGDTSPTSIDIPLPPTPSPQAIPVGDNADADCFLYQVRGTGAVLTGLTAEGKTRSVLTVPTHIDGLPVTSIGDGVFMGCAAQTIVVQTSTPVSVGQHLLDGTTAAIRVPEGAADTYKLNYFWSVYAGRIED